MRLVFTLQIRLRFNLINNNCLLINDLFKKEIKYIPIRNNNIIKINKLNLFIYLIIHGFKMK